MIKFLVIAHYEGGNVGKYLSAYSLSDAERMAKRWVRILPDKKLLKITIRVLEEGSGNVG